ncbi:hypothetical protein AXG93_601s1010 [Marchantia polymorpha subsp. ruderalis]|uniref:GH16 domain-containing protein n=1 Tax=Marchantia polymorpha subsp. ruderalis TaxID=1480154 RepID=A0A176WMQ4_MARPO|nr:hypothetical protein AXG93_601s1010 [Marchantia polymorpha subsp. ruderalis]
MKLIFTTLVLAATSIAVVQGSKFWDDFYVNFRDGKVQYPGYDTGSTIALGLDNTTGSVFQSKYPYLFGNLSMQLKLVGGNSAGTITPYYGLPRAADLGIPYLGYQPMYIYSRIWNGESWATCGGGVKTDWSLQPFLASYTNFNVWNACEIRDYTVSSSHACFEKLYSSSYGQAPNLALTQAQIDDLRGTISLKMEPPPLDRVYASLEEAETEIFAFAHRKGYNLSRLHSKVNKGGEKRKVWLACAQAGDYRNGTAGDYRNRVDVCTGRGGGVCA